MTQEGRICQARKWGSHFIGRLNRSPKPQSGHSSEVLALALLIPGPATGQELLRAAKAADESTFVSASEPGTKEACFSLEVEDMAPVLQLGPQCLFIPLSSVCS